MARNNNNNWEYWTNERHLHFLNTMEASFVQSMFKPLDRYLPDSSESTHDLGKERREGRPASDNVESSERTQKKKKKLSSQKSSEDQVVPQYDNKR